MPCLQGPSSLPRRPVCGRRLRSVSGGFFRRELHQGLDVAAEQAAVLGREDVGRHNALDKLAGAMARQGIAAAGALVITSRISVDMVQKAVMIGAPVLIAASAPTALAVTQAETSGVTLIALARGDDFEVFTHPERLIQGPNTDVA